ncbi:MAG: TlpA disulfide reductase family protein [Blastocatellia bacterium]|nr:TlpA disulfide reductase family protein [Blastocatellia bacterium]
MNKCKAGNAWPLALLAAAAMFLSGCDSAAPPRPVEGPPGGAMTSGPRPIPPPNASAIAAAQGVAIEKLDGGSFKLADFRGKVVVLDFWATYCPPCVRQMPQLAELSKRYQSQGLTVIGLTSDPKSDQKQVVEFLKKARADYLIGYDNEFISEAFLKGTEDDTGLPPIPQLFLISRDGRVVEHLIGDSPDRGIEFLEKAVNQQLSQPK